MLSFLGCGKAPGRPEAYSLASGFAFCKQNESSGCALSKRLRLRIKERAVEVHCLLQSLLLILSCNNPQTVQVYETGGRLMETPHLGSVRLCLMGEDVIIGCWL